MRKRVFKKKRPVKRTYRRRLNAVIKKVIDSRVEDKWGHMQFTHGGGVGPSTIPVYNYLTPFIRGTERSMRIGNKIRLKNIILRGYLKAHNGVAPVVRLLLIRVKGVNGVDPTLAQIFSNNTVGQHFFSDFNLNNRGELFTVVWDATFKLKFMGGANNIAPPVMFYKKFRMKNIMVDFNDGNAGTIADCVKNAYYLISMSDQGTAANTPEFSFQSTIVFEDA